MKYYTLENKIENSGSFGEIASGVIIEKKSKFISYLFNIKNEEEAISIINKIKKEYMDARHVVYIYSILDDEDKKSIRFSDDGEPQGTGTKAIYELIEKENITNICIVIVRYFGGILLGAGPLSRAYLNTARMAIDCCKKKEIYKYIEKEVKLSYNEYNIFKNKIAEYISKEEIVIDNVEFSDEVIMHYYVVDYENENIDKMVEEIRYGS